MSKKVRIYKQAAVHERARGIGKVRAAKFNHANGSETFVRPTEDEMYSSNSPEYYTPKKDNSGKALDVAGSALNAVGSLGGSGKVSKKQFWTYRDNAYNTISSIHGKEAWVQLPGNPFEKFTHANIKDSPIKNYRNDLNAFKIMLKQYYPDVFATVEGQNIIDERKKSVDINIEGSDVQDVLAGVSSDYIKELQRKKANGETLTKAEQKILDAYEYLYGKVREGAKKKVAEEIGDWLIDNWPFVIMSLVLLIILLKKK